MFASRQFHHGRSSEVTRVGAVGSDAGVNVLVRNLEKTEHIFFTRLRDDGFFRPAICRGDAFFADLYEHFAGRNHLASDGRRWRDKLVSLGNLIGIKAGTVDREVVQPALE